MKLLRFHVFLLLLVLPVHAQEDAPNFDDIFVTDNIGSVRQVIGQNKGASIASGGASPQSHRLKRCLKHTKPQIVEDFNSALPCIVCPSSCS